MNIKNILSSFDNSTTLLTAQPTGRRDMLKDLGSKVALATLPVAISSLFNKASAQTTSTTTVIGSLNFLLELEYFEYNFYRTANSTGGLIPSSDQAGFTAIENHEKEHINYLISAITTLGGTPFQPNHYANNPYCPAAYDFTAGGQYPIYTTGNYYLFLDFAQLFQDLFIRAYIGIFPNLIGDKTSLTTAMQLLSVEGRHASHVRLVRRFTTSAPDYPKPWITNNIPINYSPVNAFQSYYLGEDNIVQLNIDITTLPGITGTLSETAATEAFDEPLPQATVLSLIAPFLLA